MEKWRILATVIIIMLANALPKPVFAAGQGVPNGSTFTASSSAPGTSPAYVADYSQPDAWNSGTPQPSWIQINFPSAVYIESVGIYPTVSPGCTETYTIKGLTGGNWVTIGTQSANLVTDPSQANWSDVNQDKFLMAVTPGNYSGLNIAITSGSSWIGLFKIWLNDDPQLTGSVSGPNPTGLTISPQSSIVSVGGTQSYHVLEEMSDGSTTDVTSSSTISSSNSGIASVSGATATGISTGTVTITAIYGGLTATATLTVGPAQPPPTPPNPPTVPPMSTSGDIFHQLIDTALGPVTNFLQYAIQKMNSISQIAAQGINLDNYLGPIGVLGPPWTTLVTSLLAALLLIIIVFIARQVYNLYLALKSGVKWW